MADLRDNIIPDKNTEPAKNDPVETDDELDVGVNSLPVRSAMIHALESIHDLIGIHTMISIGILVKQLEDSGQLSPVIVHF